MFARIESPQIASQPAPLFRLFSAWDEIKLNLAHSKYRLRGNEANMCAQMFSMLMLNKSLRLNLIISMFIKIYKM